MVVCLVVCTHWQCVLRVCAVVCVALVTEFDSNMQTSLSVSHTHTYIHTPKNTTTIPTLPQLRCQVLHTRNTLCRRCTHIQRSGNPPHTTRDCFWGELPWGGHDVMLAGYITHNAYQTPHHHIYSTCTLQRTRHALKYTHAALVSKCALKQQP